MARLYLTTPIYYVNGDPHIGHAHTSITADVIKRLERMRGTDVYLTTGTDEHGQKNQEAAAASGLAVTAYLDQQSARFRALFDRLNVTYDHFVRTTAPSHTAAVSEMLRRLWAKGLIVKKMYRGLYCVGCEQFKKPSDLDEEGRCPDHLTVPVETEELNYFLTLAPFQQWLVDHFTAHEDLIQPAFFRREVLAMLVEPLDDLSISRPKSRVSLGIELPFDADYVTYVWFDALINYLSSLGWPDDRARVEAWWPAATHLMAKDIVKTHCIYWPIMLRALDIAPPAQYLVHGYWVGEGGRKMSKSLGNAVDPNEAADVVGVDGLRFYLMKNMTSIDSIISARLVTQGYNADLANTVGNLYSRVLKFAPAGALTPPAQIEPDDLAVVEECARIANDALASWQFETLYVVPKAVLDVAAKLNAHVDAVAPWKLAKDPSCRARLDSAVFALVDGLRILAELAWPVMPTMADRALATLGAPEMADRRFERGHVFAVDVAGSRMITPLTAPLFPRVKA